jgi:hypothetical protein
LSQGIAEQVNVLAVVEPPFEFMEILVEMLGRDMMIGPDNRAFEQAPDVESWTAPLLVVAVDLGQLHDYTALAAVEARAAAYRREEIGRDPEFGLPREQVVWDSGPPVRFAVRHLERQPLGTPYHEVAARVHAIMSKLPDAVLVMDATGVGRGPVDLVRHLGCRPIALTITSGEQASGDAATGEWHVPKLNLITTPLVAFQQGMMQIAAALPEAPVLREQLLALRQTILPSGRGRFEPLGQADLDGAAHDDYVLALGMACWIAEQSLIGPREVRVVSEQRVTIGR